MTNLQSLLASLESRFEDKFPLMGKCGDPKDHCYYRFEQYDNGGNDSQMLAFIKQSHEEIIQAVVEEITKAVEHKCGCCCECCGQLETALADLLSTTSTEK